MSEIKITKRIQFLVNQWQEKVLARSANDHSVETKEDFSGVIALISFDPSNRQEYLNWICRNYVEEDFLFEDKDRIKNTLNIFNNYKHKMPIDKRDIGQYKSESDLWGYLEGYLPNNGEEENDVSGKEQKRIEKAKALNSTDLLKSDNLEGWIVASPQDHFAAKWWSKGTRWCTAMKTDTYFKHYMERGPLRIFISPEGKKIQTHLNTYSFNDATDRNINIEGFLSSIPEVALDLLRKDFINSYDALVLRGYKVSPLLVTENFMTRVHEMGREQTVTLNDNLEYKLLYLPTKISMVSYGLIDFDKHTQDAVLDVILVKEDNVIASFFEDHKKFLKVLEEINDTNFITRSIESLINLWETAPKLDHKYLSSLIGSVDQDKYFDQQTWDTYIRKLSLKLRSEKSGFKKIDSKYISNENADLLAEHNLLTLLPSEFYTEERVYTFIDKKPANLVPYYEKGDRKLITNDIIKKVSQFKKGTGIKYVSIDLLTDDFINEAIETNPRVVCYMQSVASNFIDKAIEIEPCVIIDLDMSQLTEAQLIKAVSLNGNLLTHLKRANIHISNEVAVAALKSKPYNFIHVDIEITYEQALKGVMAMGGALARVPLIYRTMEMCEAALNNTYRDASYHVPPKMFDEIRMKNNEKLNPGKSNLSSRYDLNDPIHDFYHDDTIELPAAIRMLRSRLKNDPILTDPQNLIQEKNSFNLS